MIYRTYCKSKIHHARVLVANVDYEGSITIDRDLMDAADLHPFERVQVSSLRTGVRLETYVIEGERGSGMIGMNGAAALLVRSGEIIHILSYAMMDENIGRARKPIIVHLDPQNRLISAKS